jgi:hypothetical protein
MRSLLANSTYAQEEATNGHWLSLVIVFLMGQAAMHCGESNCPSHSVHLFALIWQTPYFSRIAIFGQASSQEEQPVH